MYFSSSVALSICSFPFCIPELEYKIPFRLNLWLFCAMINVLGVSFVMYCSIRWFRTSIKADVNLVMKLVVKERLMTRDVDLQHLAILLVVKSFWLGYVAHLFTVIP